MSSFSSISWDNFKGRRVKKRQRFRISRRDEVLNDDECVCVQKVCWLGEFVIEIIACLYLVEPEERIEYNRNLLGNEGGKAEAKDGDASRRMAL